MWPAVAKDLFECRRLNAAVAIFLSEDIALLMYTLNIPKNSIQIDNDENNCKSKGPLFIYFQNSSNGK